jgi:hypothetical protein
MSKNSAKPEYCEICGKELTTYRLIVGGKIYCSFKCAGILKPENIKEAGMVKHE